MFLKDIKRKVAIIVQARMGSSRLPGKVLKKLTSEYSVLGYLLKRLSKCKKADKVIVAISTNSKDDVLEAWLKQIGYSFFRGSEEDCIGRYYGAAKKFEADIIVRITSDCPLVVPHIVDEMIEHYIDSGKIDYFSNRQFTNFPEGLDTEIFTFKMLEDAENNAILKDEREHVNNYFLNRPAQYDIVYYNHNIEGDYSNFKLSIDTAEDLERARKFFAENNLPLEFSFKDLIEILTKK